VKQSLKSHANAWLGGKPNRAGSVVLLKYARPATSGVTHESQERSVGQKLLEPQPWKKQLT